MPAKIKQGKYVDSDGVQQNVVFIGAEKAIFDDDGTRLDNKLADMSKASGLTAEDAEGILGKVDANVNFQSLVDAIANKVMNELVTNSALTAQLANYVTKAMMSDAQVNDNDHVPTSSLVYNMNEDITQLNSDYYIFHVINSALSIQSSTEKSYTGLSINIPANSFCIVSAVAHFNSSPAEWVGIGEDSSHVASCYSNANVGFNHASCTYAGITNSQQKTLYVWAQYSSAASNAIELRGFYATKKE